MATIAKLLVQLDMDSGGLTKEVGQAQKAVGGLRKALTGAFAVAGGLGIAKVTSAFAGAVGGAIDFNRQMANVNSIAQMSQGELDQLSQKVLALAGPTGQAPEVLASGLYDIYSSGFSGAEGLSVLEAAAKAATAGVTGTDVAARAITAALNAYGMGADHAREVSDVLFQVVNDGVISFDQLASNMGNTLPLASSLGISLQELGAGYAQLTLQGIGASQAETDIAALMKAALNPTDALTKAVKDHGYESAQAAIESKGLTGFLAILTDTAGDDKQALFDLLGTQEAMNAALGLGKNGVKDYEKELKKMRHASDGAGATQKALAKQMESAAFKIRQAQIAIKTLVTIGFGLLAPVIAGAATKLTSFIMHGVLPFVDILKEATKGQFGFTKAVETLPQPLQRTAHAIGVVVEGFTDLTAFALRGDWARVARRLPGEARQIAGALEAIGEELLQGTTFVANIVIDLVEQFTGWLWDNRGAIWDGIKALVGWVADVGTEAIHWALDIGVPNIVGWITKIAGHVGDWLLNLLYGAPGDGTGGPQPHGSIPVALGRWTLDVAIPTLAGWAVSAAGWLNTKLQQIVDEAKKIAPKLADWIIDVAVPTLSWWIADVKKWLDEQVHAQLDGTKVSLTDWSLELGPPAHIGFGGPGFASAEDVGKQIRDALGHVDVTDFKTWALIAAAPEALFLAPITIAEAIPQMILDKLFGVTVLDFVAWALTVGIPATINAALGLAFGLAPELFTLLGGLAIKVEDFSAWALHLAVPFFMTLVDLTDKVTGLLTTTAITVKDFADWTLHVGVPATLDLAAFLADQFLQLLKDAGIAVKDFVDWLLSLGIPDIDLGFDLKTLEGAFAAKIASLGVPHIPVSAVIDWVNPFGGGDSSGGSQAPPGTEGNPDWFPGGQHFLSKFTFSIPAPKDDASPVIDGIRKSLDTLVTSTWQPTVTANAKPALDTLANATVAGAAFAGMTFTPTLNANSRPFLGILTDSVRAAVAFANTTFTTTLSANGGPAAATIGGLFAEGYAWSGTVFTATFSINTSPLLAALATVRAVAAEVAALMPHSPAKKGPLKKPISFGYIADNLEAAMGRLGPSARAGLAGINQALGGGVNVGASGFSAGGVNGSGGGFNNYGTITVVANNPEQFMQQMRAYALNGSRGGR